MKCLANNKQFKRVVTRDTSAAVPCTTRYFTAATCDILLSHTIGWSNSRVYEFMRTYEKMFIAVHINHADKGVGCSFEDIRATLLEDYGYEPRLNNSVVSPGARGARLRTELNTDMSIKYLASVVALIMLDKFGCSIETVERFMERYDRRIKRYARGDREYIAVLDKLREEKGFDLTVEVR